MVMSEGASLCYTRARTVSVSVLVIEPLLSFPQAQIFFLCFHCLKLVTRQARYKLGLETPLIFFAFIYSKKKIQSTVAASTQPTKCPEVRAEDD